MLETCSVLFDGGDVGDSLTACMMSEGVLLLADIPVTDLTQDDGDWQWTFLCQEMRDACRRGSESLSSPRSLCSECQEGRRRCSDAWVPSFNVRLGLQAGYSFEHFVPSSD